MANARPKGRTRVLLVMLGACVAAYATLFVVVNFADRLLLWPNRAPMPIGGAKRVMLPLDGGQLEVLAARSDPANEPRAYLLRFYGNADRADPWVAPEAAGYAGRRALEVWGVNYPGFGTSSGRASLRGVARAAETAFDALAKTAGGRPIFVLGNSMGTTAALHLAATRNVAGLVLQNPPPLRQLVVGEHGWWNLWMLAVPVSLQVPAELDSIANAGRAKAPAIFVSSEKDSLVPVRYQARIVEAYAGKKQSFTIPGADHVDPMTPEIARQVDGAFATMLDAAR